jgi:NAD(P)H-hydrate epimerase
MAGDGTIRTFDLPQLPDRPADAHKGTFGTVVVIGGSPQMIGAPALAASAALRSGTGLVRIMTREDVLPFCLTIEPSATGLAMPAGQALSDFARQFGSLDQTIDDNAVLAIGPGIGVGEEQQELLRLLLRLGRRSVIDADGLNNLAHMDDPARAVRGPVVLTPHPGEFRRLASPSGIDGDPTDPQQRQDLAARLAQRCHAVVVLKGAGTVISDGQRCHVNDTGNPSLATAGSGDVLTGLIAGLTAQGMELYEASVLGVHLHGLAADLWTDHYGPRGLVARELAGLIPSAMQRYAGGEPTQQGAAEPATDESEPS